MREKTIKLTTVQKWNDLTAKQLFFIMKLFIMNIEPDNALFRILLYLTKIKLLKKYIYINGVQYYKFRKGSKKFLLSADNVLQMIKSLCWLLDESKLTKNPLPVFSIFATKYFGPSDFLYNITLREFIFAEMNFISFCQSKHVCYLNNLIAILWRKQVEPYEPNTVNYNGDRRERFNDSIFTNRSRKLIWLKLNKKYALFNFYAGCRTQLQTEYPNIFTTSKSVTVHKNLSKQMTSLVRAINGGDPSKNEQLMDLNIRCILDELESAREKITALQK